jgi:3'-phosphoadenosine 5'-phosphosulfate sulfotransferase (PAPS reductase)/FAD synthetase
MIELSLTDDAIAMLKAGALVSFSVSGGKDGAAAALLFNKYLDEIGHPKERRMLIHADLGSIEWKDSLPSCKRLSEFLGLPLTVVQRNGGGMVERWLSRWESSIARYKTLSTVMVVSPWSSATNRFCTSELKMDPIGSAMKKWARTFAPTKGSPLNMISVLGLRRAESVKRSKAPTLAPFLKADLPKSGINAFTLNPILTLSKEEVFQVHKDFGFPLHVGYGLGNERISCLFCVLAGSNDLTVGARQPEAHAVYRQLVQLEVDSLFSFQGSRWLGSINPEILSDDLRAQLVTSVLRAEKRREIEAGIPKELHYVKGWPTRLPSLAEAEIICRARNAIAELYNWDKSEMAGMTPAAVIARYQQLMDAQVAKTVAVRAPVAELELELVA